jgi:sialate O-acetylesterase
MVVITDCGADVHPRDKTPVGARLALAARAISYGEKVEYSGPVYESFKVDSNIVIIRFSHVAGGLEAKGGELKGFTIAGADKSFVPASASIEGETVVVSSSEVAQPVSVRFGWAKIPDVNLFNKAGLPASPFRTDVE